MENILNEVQTLIEREAASKIPFLIAIDGRCASGKTTLAHALSDHLNANLIHMDDFFLRPEQRTPQRLAVPGENIDHERFLTEVLLPLKEGIPFAYRPFSCSNMSLGEPVTVLPKPIAVVEGSYSCHPDLREHYDLRLFLTVSPEEQMRRLRERDGAYAEVFREKWIPLEESYFSACRVEEDCFRTLKINFCETNRKNCVNLVKC